MSTFKLTYTNINGIIKVYYNIILLNNYIGGDYMAKKLSQTDLQNICKRYVFDDISMEQLAKDYACSSSHISKSIHNAIVLSIVDIDMANKIKIKASNNMDKKMREMRI